MSEEIETLVTRYREEARAARDVANSFETGSVQRVAGMARSEVLERVAIDLARLLGDDR